MATFSAIIFLIIELFLIIFAVLLIQYLGFRRLESNIGIRRDGIRYGKLVPSWHLSDISGQVHSTPAKHFWQFLIFTDHSLQSFPDLLRGVNNLSNQITPLEILVIARGSFETCYDFAQKLNLQAPVIPVDQNFYNRYKVRIMPFAYLVDPSGIVRWVGLINTEEQLVNIWELTQARVNHDFVLEGGSI